MFKTKLLMERRKWSRDIHILTRERVFVNVGACSGSSSRRALGSISNDPNFRLKHPGVPDGSDSSDGTSYTLTENYTLPVAQATCRVAYVPPLLCGDVYASSERHVCYTLRRGGCYAEAVYTMPGDRRQAWEHLESQSCIQFVFSSMYLCIYVSI